MTTAIPTLNVPTNLTDDQKGQVTSEIAKAWTNPSVKNALDIDINDFTKKTKELVDLFDSVYFQLGQIDNLGLDPRKLAPEWNGYRLTFRKLVWNSRDLATQIATSAEQFETIILPLVIDINKKEPMDVQKADIEEILEGIDQYIEMNDVNKQNSIAQADAFKDLTTALSLFGKTLVNFGAAQAEKNRKEINEISAKINELSNVLNEYYQKMNEIGQALGAFSSGINISAFAPSAWNSVVVTGLLKSGFSGINAELVFSSAQDVENKVADLERKRELLQRENDLIVATQMKLDNLVSGDIARIIAGLSMFETVWNAVNSDCEKLKKYLTDFKQLGSKPKWMPIIMIGYLKNANTIYWGLCEALTKYATGIVDSGIAKP